MGGVWCRQLFVNIFVEPHQEKEIFFSLFKLNTEQWLIFPGGAATPKMGVLTYFFDRKLHENERIWTTKGGASLAPPLGPPLQKLSECLLIT